MNRRNVISMLALALMVPATLAARPPKGKPESPSCKDCKKCGHACKCNCKKKCKCKPGCCKAERPSPPHRPSSDRHSRYKEMMKKFDKNKDGRLDEKERDTARKFMQERFKSER